MRLFTAFYSFKDGHEIRNFSTRQKAEQWADGIAENYLISTSDFIAGEFWPEGLFFNIAETIVDGPGLKT